MSDTSDTTRFTASVMDEYTGHLAITDGGRWDDRYLCTSLDDEQVRYAVMVLNAGGLGDIDALALDEFEDLVAAAVERDDDGLFAAEKQSWAF